MDEVFEAGRIEKRYWTDLDIPGAFLLSGAARPPCSVRVEGVRCRVGIGSSCVDHGCVHRRVCKLAKPPSVGAAPTGLRRHVALAILFYLPNPSPRSNLGSAHKGSLG